VLLFQVKGRLRRPRRRQVPLRGMSKRPCGHPYSSHMDFNRDELLWINGALNEVLNGPEAIEEWEFHTRMGGDRDQVRALLRKVSDQVSALSRADPDW
jgi:hypothetical protein